MSRVVVTGVGLLSSLGIGIECFADALREGESAIQEISGFEHQRYPIHCAGIIDDFEVDEFLPSPKNYLDRNSELSFAAFSLALEDSGLDLDDCGRDSVALLWASAFAGIETMNRFFQDVHRKGARFAKPILFPHTYANTAVSLLSIEYKLSGPHLNFAGGWDVALQSLCAGVDLIRSGRSDIVFVGAAEAFSEALLRHCLARNWCSGGRSVPFAADSKGIIPGEAGGMLVLEKLEHALDRGAPIYAELSGTGLAHGNDSGRGAAIVKAMNGALSEGGCAGPGEIDAVYVNADGLPLLDSAEKDALSEVFADCSTRITGVKPLTGECFGAAGMVQVAAALCSLNDGVLPHLSGLSADSASFPFAIVAEQPEIMTIDKVLVNSLDPGGNAASLVLAKLDG